MTPGEKAEREAKQRLSRANAAEKRDQLSYEVRGYQHALTPSRCMGLDGEGTCSSKNLFNSVGTVLPLRLKNGMMARVCRDCYDEHMKPIMAAKKHEEERLRKAAKKK